ncbi:MAG: hypothetical protein EAZ18_00370 [Oscillatoriales cyanobacterium]|nr:MAG: hypothetical protein EAZ18_00370 [Oscillatoriales cyanobacterium]
MVTVVPEICTLRSQMAKQKVRRWTRKYFTEQVLGVARQTTYNWEELIVEVYFETDGEKFSDYLFDPGTGEAILIPGEPWNHHQMEVLAYIKKFMSRKPKPLKEELKRHLIANADRLTHKTFLEEFNQK